MQIRADQLPARLGARTAGGAPLFVTVCGDEPLLVQEAADAVRAAARREGCSEREVFHLAGAHPDWSAVLGAAQSQGLFADAKLIELRLPTGKPGKDGAEALQRYVETLPPEGVATLVLLPRLDGTQAKSGWMAALDGAGWVVKVEGIDRAALPAWIAQRLARQQQHVCEGVEGERTLAFFADRVEGNLLAAHQELEKLALLHPPGELRYEDVESAVLDVARYDVRQCADAVLAGQAERALRMLAGLRAEGESVVSVHWQLADDLRAAQRARQALDAGQPMPMALQTARVWGQRQRALERALPRLDARALLRLVSAASVCDGVLKGLKRPDWPEEPWDALAHWVGMTLRATGAAAPARQRTVNAR